MAAFSSPTASAVQQISVRFGNYLIGSDGVLPQQTATEEVRDALKALNVLRGCAGNHYDMRVLRTEVADAQRNDQIREMSDVTVVHLAVSLVCCGRLRLVGTLPLRAVNGVPVEIAPPAPLVAAAPAARGPAGEVVVPSFAPDLDAAALAAGLRAASQDGTPFCEECARAARAA